MDADDGVENRDGPPLDALISALKATRLSDVPETVLLEIGHLSSAGWLRRDAPQHGYWARVWAARALMRRPDDGALDALVAALADPEWRVREMACKALGRIGSVDALGPLAARLEDAAPRVRAAAAVALGRIGDEEVVGALQAAFWDPDSRVQGAVGRALERLGKQGEHKVRPYGSR